MHTKEKFTEASVILPRDPGTLRQSQASSAIDLDLHSPAGLQKRNGRMASGKPGRTLNAAFPPECTEFFNDADLAAPVTRRWPRTAP
ncbi:hypothetical protein AA23498_1003 [Acetobacter nitrogenifigens DSM 23921 = NBRC 105050]|uniref:Uncharacterized protein n=1 Tax=Acetobacter nitrogenifigens DSM 23921 = NBRC 105050 TaxID=1120919 RepID=A0A511XB25_9PROT|nr:hypothetical protein AA23498_1003 [Acetobacter nitrogenifigens DSM 23921 = NBRC 105050]GEN60071.1 hypothetical protein ANI02nite_19550 [Acetobacter nitrogenifigens DSM 23921 = NBRC 105050]